MGQGNRLAISNITLNLSVLETTIMRFFSIIATLGLGASALVIPARDAVNPINELHDAYGIKARNAVNPANELHDAYGI
jgi:hypothetical protein